MSANQSAKVDAIQSAFVAMVANPAASEEQIKVKEVTLFFYENKLNCICVYFHKIVHIKCFLKVASGSNVVNSFMLVFLSSVQPPQLVPGALRPLQS